jgi:BlaI family transcriptional regulator, penicillinase repressor
MSKPRRHRLGDLQLKIMKVLWDQGSASVPQVHDALRAEQLAYTTVATMLRKMEARGLVSHTEENRRFIYRARVTADAVTQSMSHDMVDRLFQGSLADMVTHLLETREVSREELIRLEQLIAQKKQKL